MNLKKKILAVTIIPVLVLGIVSNPYCNYGKKFCYGTG